MDKARHVIVTPRDVPCVRIRNIQHDFLPVSGLVTHQREIPVPYAQEHGIGNLSTSGQGSEKPYVLRTCKRMFLKMVMQKQDRHSERTQLCDMLRLCC